jgi:hypothetical protein
VKHLIRYAWLRLLGYRQVFNPVLKQGGVFLTCHGWWWVKNRGGIHMIAMEEK